MKDKSTSKDTDASTLVKWAEAFLVDKNVNNPKMVEFLAKHGKIVRYKKSEKICAAGDYVKHFSIIYKGLVRFYYCTPEGKEWNKAFYKENETAIAASAYLTGEPASFTIEALEDTILLSIPIDNIELMIKHFPETQALTHQLIVGGFIRNEHREAILLTLNAEQRYQWLLNNQSDLVTRIPQFHLASYLGMDAVSLSRIKSKFES